MNMLAVFFNRLSLPYTLQVSLSLTSQTFIVLSQLEPLYNDGISPLLDSLGSQGSNTGNTLEPVKDTLSSLLIGVPGKSGP